MVKLAYFTPFHKLIFCVFEVEDFCSFGMGLGARKLIRLGKASVHSGISRLELKRPLKNIQFWHKVKEGDNFNHRNILNISRVEI